LDRQDGACDINVFTVDPLKLLYMFKPFIFHTQARDRVASETVSDQLIQMPISKQYIIFVFCIVMHVDAKIYFLFLIPIRIMIFSIFEIPKNKIMLYYI
jgi:hypothetical protein